MPNWKEQYDQRFHEVTAGGVTGQRLFQTASDGTAVLPSIGDEMVDEDGAGIDNCLAYKIRTQWNVDGKNTLIYQKLVLYKTPSTDDPGEPDPGITAETRTYSVGGEVVSLENPEPKWAWNVGSGTVDVPIYKEIPIVEFSIPVIDLSESEANSYKGDMEDVAGTINSVEFEGYRIGSVLFLGASGTTYYNQEGNIRWRFELQFKVRTLNDPFSNISQDDWQHIWNPELGIWDKPETIAAGDFLYDTSDLKTALGL